LVVVVVVGVFVVIVIVIVVVVVVVIVVVVLFVGGVVPPTDELDAKVVSKFMKYTFPSVTLNPGQFWVTFAFAF
jgi:hypothetical protein